MSKIGYYKDIKDTFKPIITNLTETELNEIKVNNKSINISNAFIISIPQDNDEDIEGQGSIWLTDKDGYLYQLTKPIGS